jgi:hypothetical protein
MIHCCRLPGLAGAGAVIPVGDLCILMCVQVRWPVGVKPGGLLHPSHDVALLRAELEPNTGYTYSWVADVSEPPLEEALMEQLELGG